MLADQTVDQDFFDSAQIVLSSASSKTAYGTAPMLKGQGREIVGLTSQRNWAATTPFGLTTRSTSLPICPRSAAGGALLH